jgi:hypothetical protein
MISKLLMVLSLMFVSVSAEIVSPCYLRAPDNLDNFTCPVAPTLLNTANNYTCLVYFIPSDLYTYSFVSLGLTDSKSTCKYEVTRTVIEQVEENLTETEADCLVHEESWNGTECVATISDNEESTCDHTLFNVGYSPNFDCSNFFHSGYSSESYTIVSSSLETIVASNTTSNVCCTEFKFIEEEQVENNSTEDVNSSLDSSEIVDELVKLNEKTLAVKHSVESADTKLSSVDKTLKSIDVTSKTLVDSVEDLKNSNSQNSDRNNETLEEVKIATEESLKTQQETAQNTSQTVSTLKNIEKLLEEQEKVNLDKTNQILNQMNEGPSFSGGLSTDGLDSNKNLLDSILSDIRESQNTITNAIKESYHNPVRFEPISSEFSSFSFDFFGKEMSLDPTPMFEKMAPLFQILWTSLLGLFTFFHFTYILKLIFTGAL